MEEAEWLEGSTPSLCICWKQSRIPGGISINAVVCSSDAKLLGGSFQPRAAAIDLSLVLPHLHLFALCFVPACSPLNGILCGTQNSQMEFNNYAKEVEEQLI